MPPRSPKRARISELSPRTEEAAVKVEEVVVSVFEAKGEIKVEEITENKPDEEKLSEPEPNPVVAQGVYEALELRDGGSDDLGKSVLKERDEGTSRSVAERSTTKSMKKFLQGELRRSMDSVLDERRVEIYLGLRLFQLEMNVNLLEITNEVMRHSVRDNERAHLRFEDFCRDTQYYTQYFDFCDYLQNECKFIKYDSDPKEVYDSGELPMSRFDMLSEGIIIDLLESYSYTMGSKVKEMSDLEFEYSVYLTECDFITCDSDASEILPILKEEKKFKDMKLSSLREDVLNWVLEEYMWYLSYMEFKPEKFSGTTFSEIIRKKIETPKSVKWPPVDHWKPEALLVHRAHSKKYSMDEDPLTELMKLYPDLSESFCFECCLEA